MKDDVNGHILLRPADGSQDLLAVLDIDIPGKGNAKEADRLLAVDEGYNLGAPGFAQPGQDALSFRLQIVFLQHRNQKEQYEYYEPGIAEQGVEDICAGLS